MIRLFNHYFRRQALLEALLDLGLVLLAFIVLYLSHFGDVHQAFPAATHGLSLVAALLVTNTVSGLYQLAHGRSLNQSCARAALALLLALPLAYLLFGLLPEEIGNRRDLKWVVMVCVAGVIAHRVYAAHIDKPSHSRLRVLIYGSGTAAQLVARTLQVADPHAQMVGYVAGPNETEIVVDPDQLLKGSRSLKERANELHVDEIVVAVTERRGGSMPLRELLDCKAGGVQVLDLSMYYEKMLCQIRLDHLHAGWLIFGDGFAQGTLRDIAKRMFDIICATVLLLLAAPILLFTALAIMLEDGAPVFYRQERIGLDGRSFSVYKFRSMRADAEIAGRPQWAAAHDTRVTRVGALIRRFRIDEFPQLLNVLSGEMSLVGPRPERPYFVTQLTDAIPFYAARHSVKPGVTGWAQVRYQYGATVADSLEKLQYDLYYVKNHTLLLDTVILFETVGVVLSGKGAR